MKKPAAVLSGIFGAMIMLATYGCGGPADTPAPLPTVAPTPATGTISLPAVASTAPPSTWVPPTALVGTPIPGAEATLTAAPRLQTGTITITNTVGEQVKMTLEVADTEPSRELGLMFRESMPPDAGMIFDFKGETTSGFWMQNTILPLSIAFIQQDGSIVSVADMQPLDISTVNAAGPYYYAIEANQGFFRAHNINPGDKVSLPVDTNILVPGMPSVGK
jgi:uncharacterized membrane protein (UPF0127 family)